MSDFPTLLVDMSLTREWIPFFRRHGFAAQHWSTAGKANASDSEIMAHARAAGQIVFTHDLDFGTLLALTRAAAPSVIQIRVSDPDPTLVGDAVVAAIRRCAESLKSGALLVVEPARHRLQLLPLVLTNR